MQVKELIQLIISDDPVVEQYRNQAIAGNTSLLNTFLQAFNNMLKNPMDHDKVYKHVN